MEDNDLKKIWKEMHTGMECKSIDIKEIIHKKHSVVISRVLHRQKSLICLFAFSFNGKGVFPFVGRKYFFIIYTLFCYLGVSTVYKICRFMFC